MRADSDSPAARVARAAGALARARGRAAVAEDLLRREIVAALQAGMSASRIAEIAGISRARVYQIRDGRR